MSSSSDNIALTPHPATRPTRLLCAGATDTGLVRAHNEDHFGLFPEIGLFVVADGLGGCCAGEVAAHMAIDLVYEGFVEPDPAWIDSDVGPQSTGRAQLVAAIKRAHHHIHEAAEQTPGWKGMGTTIAAALALNGRMALAHVGDSRIYRLRGRRLELLTEDHSLFNCLVHAGLADPDHPEDFEQHNIITRALGVKPDVQVDARWVDVAVGDTFLLCSDGLTGHVKVSDLAEILRAHLDLEYAVERLIARANELGGPDNVTAVLVRAG